MPFSLPSLSSLRLKQKQHEPSSDNGPGSLPYEILHIIFAMVMEARSLDPDLTEKSLLRSSIFAISQVCKQWRLAARDCSRLWVHSIDFQGHSPVVVADLLHLSQPHLIPVGHRSAPFRISQGRPREILALLKQERHRVREWNLVGNAEFWTQGDFGRILATPTCVDTLRIQALPTKSTKLVKGRKYMPIPPVQKLCLYDTSLEVSPSTDLSNVTELSITSMSSRSTKYHIMDVIAVLRQTPQLQFLRLNGAIKPGPEYDPIVANQPIPPVNLADLRLVSLSESGWEAASLVLRLLPILQKPPRCGLDLSLPPYANLPHPSVPENMVRSALSRAQRSLHGGSVWMPPFTAPRVEMALRTYRSGLQLTVGTVSDPQEKLNWNGRSGTIGVGVCLDKYFEEPRATSTQPHYPPITVGLSDPEALDVFSTAGILTAGALFSTKCLRITMGPSPNNNAFSAINAIIDPLVYMRHVETLNLDARACAAILPALQGRTYANANRASIPFYGRPDVRGWIFDSQPLMPRRALGFDSLSGHHARNWRPCGFFTA